MRRLLCHEPRGHADMYGCFLVPPDDDGADLGVLFWHKDGYSTACGHGTIALGAWAVERGRVAAPADGEVDVTIDVPSGRVVARVSCRGGAVERVAFRNVPSFVHRARRARGAASRSTSPTAARSTPSSPAERLGLRVAPERPAAADRGRPRGQARARRHRGRAPSARRAAVGHLRHGAARGRSARGTSATSTIFADGEVDRSPTRLGDLGARRRCSPPTACSRRARPGATTRSSARRSARGRSARRRRGADRGRGHGVPDGRAPLHARPARPARHGVRAAGDAAFISAGDVEARCGPAARWTRSRPRCWRGSIPRRTRRAASLALDRGELL